MQAFMKSDIDVSYVICSRFLFYKVVFKSKGFHVVVRNLFLSLVLMSLHPVLLFPLFYFKFVLLFQDLFPIKNKVFY